MKQYSHGVKRYTVYTISDIGEEETGIGSGILREFLKLPHRGVFCGTIQSTGELRILIDIWTHSKKEEDIKKSVLNYSELILAKEHIRRNEYKFRDKEAICRINFHVNGKGILSYVSVPKSCMRNINSLFSETFIY